MSSLVEVAKTADLEDGAMKRITAGGRVILLARAGDKYYAVSNTCTHRGGNLSAGRLEGTVVTCPLHGSQFDITDGRVIRWMKGSGLVSAVSKSLKSLKPIPTYPVKIKDDVIWVEL